MESRITLRKHFVVKIRAWLELIRLPNLFTVPGDPLAGMFLAYALTKQSAGFSPEAFFLTAGWLLLASLMLYTAGLLLNDFVDYSEDLATRPGRPLPSGRVKRTQAMVAGALLLGGAQVVATIVAPQSWLLVSCLILLILLYNFFLKRIPFLGVFTMGLCRGANVLLGASVLTSELFHPLLVSAGLVSTFYIFAVSLLAKDETQKLPAGFKKYLPLIGCCGILVFAIGYGVTSLLLYPVNAASYNLAVFLLAIFFAIAIFILYKNIMLLRFMSRMELKQLPGVIGAYIRLLIPIQTLFCSLGALLILSTSPLPAPVDFLAPGLATQFWDVMEVASGIVAPLILLGGYILAGRVGRVFYGS